MGDDPSDKKPSPPMQNAAVLACPAPPAETAAADAAPAAASGGGGGAGPGVVMVKRAALVACLTCQLCGRLLRDPATITECLHTCEFPVPPPSLLAASASSRSPSVAARGPHFFNSLL
jgi:hypothetical protein